MPITTILLITLAAFLALGFVVFNYFLGNKMPVRSTYFLAGFRFFTVFLILLLLINPTVKQLELETLKPDLIIGVDQSASMGHLEVSDSVRALTNYLKAHEDLRERFNIQVYGFGKDINRIETDTFSFDKQQTNISNSLKKLTKLSSEKAAVILATDGNQTVGEDFQFFKTNQNSAVFPVIAGDTSSREDLAISNLNVNKYAFLNNQFPVEVIINYSGNTAVESTFEIRLGNSVVLSRELNFNSEENTQVITGTLPASSLGTKIYEAEIKPVEGERNLINNTSRFGIEVIDERTSVLIISDVTHPDLGTFKKAIEQNEQRDATIAFISELNNFNINDFQLIIIYQPNNKFKSVFDQLDEQGLNYLLVTGMKTDWAFLNSVQDNFNKDHTNQPQEFFPIYNPNYSRFQFDDIGFNRFPPLIDAFGNLELLNSNLEPLLYQQLEGIETTTPLLATFQDDQIKSGVLFGENLWMWRAHSFVQTGSFEEFDGFFGKLIQFLSANQKRDRLTFEAEPFYPQNEEVVITARFYDENYQFNPQGDLRIVLENKTAEVQKEAQLLLNQNRYQVSLDNLEPGEYDFEIREQNSGLTRTGSFSVIEYNIEQQFSSANLTKMKTLAENTSSKLYFLNNPDFLIADLMEDNRFTAVQKSREKTVPLINWKILLILLIISLSAEWFTRKYFGLI